MTGKSEICKAGRAGWTFWQKLKIWCYGLEFKGSVETELFFFFRKPQTFPLRCSNDWLRLTHLLPTHSVEGNLLIQRLLISVSITSQKYIHGNISWVFDHIARHRSLQLACKVNYHIALVFNFIHSSMMFMRFIHVIACFNNTFFLLFRCIP